MPLKLLLVESAYKCFHVKCTMLNRHEMGMSMQRS